MFILKYYFTTLIKKMVSLTAHTQFIAKIIVAGIAKYMLFLQINVSPNNKNHFGLFFVFIYVLVLLYKYIIV